MSTGPELVRYAVEPMKVSMRASPVIVATAVPPLKPIAATPTVNEFAMAVLSPIAWIVMPDVPVN